MPERRKYRPIIHRTGPRSEAEVIHAMASRLLANPKTQEPLMAELDQVVYEYGKLHLNFVACQRQNTLLATQLAQANKRIAELEKAPSVTVVKADGPVLVEDQAASPPAEN